MSDLTDPTSGQSKTDPNLTGGTVPVTSPTQDLSAGGVITPGSVKLGTPGKRPAVQFSPTAGYTPGTSTAKKFRRAATVPHETVSLDDAIAFDATFGEDEATKEDNLGAPSTVSRITRAHSSSTHVSHAHLFEKESGVVHPGVLSHNTGEQDVDDTGPPVTTVPQPGAPSPVLPVVSPPPVRFARTSLVEKLAGDPVDPRSSLSPTGTRNATTHNPGDFAGGPAGHTAAPAPVAPAAASPGISFRSPVRSSPTAVAAAAPVLSGGVIFFYTII
eukprot:SAG11_NODE_6841_length_1237_cov_2.882250_2_plen_273_part_00